MATQRAEGSPTLFDQYYDADDKTLKGLEKDSVKRGIMISMQSAANESLQNINNANRRLLQNRKNLANYNINNVVGAARDLSDEQARFAAIKAEYLAMFGSELTIGGEVL